VLEVECAVAAPRAAYDTTWGPMKPADRRRLLDEFLMVKGVGVASGG
jgi:hypothetical protein